MGVGGTPADVGMALGPPIASTRWGGKYAPLDYAAEYNYDDYPNNYTHFLPL